MGLISSKTKWALFLAANGDPEHRHIQDLAFGLFCLESAGISPQDIFIYVDGSNRHDIDQLISAGSNASYKAYASNEFFVHQKANAHENLVLFVSGHGGVEGIEAATPIAPFFLLNVIKSSPGLKNAVVYLGQCYAGVFNYIGAGKKAPDDVNVIFIGATSLHESISMSTSESVINGTMNWVANIFLLNVFRWISNPVDVDGDGKSTVMDSFKYAGSASNVANKELKIGSFVKSIGLHEEWVTAKAAHEAAPTDLAIGLKFDALTQKYVVELGIRYIHQECWILNAIPAQFLEI